MKNDVKPQSRVLVTGATGAVGPLVVEAFHAAGYFIRTLSIDPPPIGIWHDDVETRIGDVTDASAVEAAMEGVDSVIHLAALLHIVNPSPDLQEKYERINIGGTLNVVSKAIQAGVGRVVLFSTIAVYGQSGGRILTEDTPPDPDSFYARTKLAAEKILLEAKGADGEQIGAVLRLGAVYGSRVKGNYHRLLQSLARGHFIPIGHGSNRRSLIYDKDVARAALFAVEHPCAAGKIFNVTDNQFHTLNEIIAAICVAIGRNKPCLSLPIRPARLTARIIEEAARLMGCQPPITRAMVDKYVEDIAVESHRIQKEIGFIPKFGLEEGWKDAVQEMRRLREL